MNSEENKEYSVNWKNHMSHVRKAFDNLLTSSELTDVTLCCEGKKIGAHKMLLSACSNYFRDTFKDVPCQHPVIILYGVEFTVLTDILRFIYNGEVSVDTSKLDSFLKTAQLLQISGLTDDSSTDKTLRGLQQNVEEPQAQEQQQSYTEPAAPPTSTSEEPKRGQKRLRTKEEAASTNKIVRQDTTDTLFVSDVKCEPSELVNFEDPLEDPLLQSEQSNDTHEFFETGQAGVEEEFKIYKTEIMDEEEYKESEIDFACDALKVCEDGDSSLSLPAKSKAYYQKMYNGLNEWLKQKRIDKVDENALLTYFVEKSEKIKPPTLWCRYSILKTMLMLEENIDVTNFRKIVPFLKKKSLGYRSVKSKSFTKEQLTAFLTQASDETYLMLKVALILGISGACNCEELVKMLVDDIEDVGSAIIGRISNPETKTARTFAITDSNFIELYRKYFSLRPTKIFHRRFFVKYAYGKCSTQVVGVNKLGSIPRLVATYLKLPNPEMYTGHCYRGTSAALLASAGVEIRRIQSSLGPMGVDYGPSTSYVDAEVNVVPKKSDVSPKNTT